MGMHPAERQLFQYTIDLSVQKSRNSKVKTQRKSKPKAQKCPAEPRAAKQRKPKRDPTPVAQRAPVSTEELAQSRHTYNDSRNKNPNRKEQHRLLEQERRRKAREQGLCRDCRNPAIPAQTRCPTCANRHRVSRRRWQAERRVVNKQ